MEKGEVLWTVDGDETSWSAWAEDMAEAPASTLMEELIQANQIATPGWALDVGCGTGRAFLPLNQAGYRVIGIEANRRGIQLSQKRAHRGGLQAWPIQASAVQLPVSDASVDLVFAVGVLFHLGPTELVLALKEIQRVLKNKGKAILHFLDCEDWRRNLAPKFPPERVTTPSYEAVITCFSSQKTIQRCINEAGLGLESLELRASHRPEGEQRNWLTICRK